MLDKDICLDLDVHSPKGAGFTIFQLEPLNARAQGFYIRLVLEF